MEASWRPWPTSQARPASQACPALLHLAPLLLSCHLFGETTAASNCAVVLKPNLWIFEGVLVPMIQFSDIT